MPSDDMVEKARAWRKEYTENLDEQSDAMPLVNQMADFARSAVRDAVSECADFVMNWRNEDGNQQFGHYVIAAALRQKFGVEGDCQDDY